MEDTKGNVTLTVELDAAINYAILQMSGSFIRDICVKNETEQEYDDLTLRISGGTELIEPTDMGIQKLRPKEELHLKDVKANVNVDYLAALTERCTCNVKVSVMAGEEELAAEVKEIIVLAYDQWTGQRWMPELLAAFSMPNHPVVASLLELSTKYLEKWTGEPSLAGYQFGDPNRVMQMAGAAYAAIQEKNITYATAPSGFEVMGQRVRLPDAVMDRHMGNCMDMTLLYVACLEAMGLNPFMVLVKGHIFAGVWLVENSFSNMIMDDPSQIEKRMSNGINELIVVECTDMCAGKTRSFDEAIKSATQSVANYKNFEFAIDVKRARSMGVRPLPIRVKTDSGFEVKHLDRKEKDVTVAPTAVSESFDFSNLGEKQEVTKQLQWERKLLDLSMRNSLINMRFTKAVAPLLCTNVSILEDALSDGEEFLVLPRPDELGGGVITVETLTELGPFTEYIELESKHKRLHSIYTEKELNSCLTKLYRSAKSSMEENGASTLYLALGLWQERKGAH